MVLLTERKVTRGRPKARSLGKTRAVDLSHLNGRNLFRGCEFCAYEVGGGRGPCSVIPRATLSVRTKNGTRQLCAAHAKRGAWG